MRVLIAGGGTAGHIYPGLAVAHALRNRSEGSAETPDHQSSKVHFVHGPSRIDTDVLAHSGVDHESIDAAPMRGRAPHRALLSVLRSTRATAQAAAAIRRFRPAVVFCTGGYVSAPVLLAARMLGVPSVIFLPDVVPGFTIRLLAPFATRVTVGFAATCAIWRRKKLSVTGYPVRPDFLVADRRRGRASHRIDGTRPVVFVMGGSSGARSINYAIGENLEPLLHLADVIHLSGDHDENYLRSLRNALDPDTRRRYHLYRYLHRGIADAMAASDLVVCRAGASTLAELPILGVPGILVPYPHAGAHQEQNAQVLAEVGGAIVVADDALQGGGPDDPRSLLDTVMHLTGSSSLLQSMSASTRTLARPDASSNLVAVLTAVARREEHMGWEPR